MKKPIKYITHQALRCLICGDIIISWSRHDYKNCSCGNGCIDGGFDYLRYGWKDKRKVKLFNIRVPKEMKQ